MIISTMFDIGQIVFIKMDEKQQERMVTGLLIRPNGVQYDLSAGSTASWHYEIELSIEKNVLKTTG